MFIDVDARGLTCPAPVIATKKALASITEGVVRAIVDNAVAKENVSKFAIANQCQVSTEKKEGLFYLTITKGTPEILPEILPEESLKLPTPTRVTYLITQNTMGHGNAELGAVLIKAFLYTLSESRPLPQSVLFINSGVMLTTEGSAVLAHLTALQEGGVKILSCGTCLDYYHLKDKLAVGATSNMYTIVEEISNSAVKSITL